MGRRLGVDVLDGRMAVVRGVRFFGSDSLDGLRALRINQRSIDHAMAAAQYGMSDFHYIRYENRAFQPADARSINLERVRWLRAKLAQNFQGVTIVVTHHLPLRQSATQLEHCQGAVQKLLRRPRRTGDGSR